MTRVSVITPYLDAEAHLLEAIESVRAQTEHDWELLLVDDGSTDASSSIAAAAAGGDPRVRLLTRPSNATGGAAAARNLGIAAATGEFVAFLDSDDVLEPHMLATTLAAADRHPTAAMIFGPTQWWYPEGGAQDWVEPTYRRAGRVHRPPTLLRSLILLQQGQVPCTCSVLIRRSAAEAVGGFDVRFRLYEDQTLWAKLFSRYDVYVTPVPLSRYRQHRSSMSARATVDGEYNRMGAHSARRTFLKWVEAYLLSGSVGDRKLARALRLAQAPYIERRTLRRWLDRQALAWHRWRWRQRCRFWREIHRLARLGRRATKTRAFSTTRPS